LGSAKVLDSNQRQSGRRRNHPRRGVETCSKRGRFFWIFFWQWWDLVFAWGFGKNGWLDVVFGGEVVVDRW
jgi:hypothetical protein